MKKKDQDEIVDVFVMHERIYKWCGIWPLKKDYIKFGIFLIYFVIDIVLAYADLITVFGNLHLMVENLLETLVLAASFFMTIVIRFHPALGDLITAIRNEITSKDYRSDEERYLYYVYNRIAYNLSKIAITSSALTVTAMYFKPLPNALHAIFKSLGRNGTALAEDDLLLPFRRLQIFPTTDTRIYFLLCIYRLPCIYLGVIHTQSICLILGLVLHVCGRLSILAQRIKTVETRSKDGLETAIRRNVQDHLKLIELRSHSVLKSIENIFQYILLFDLVQTSIRLGLSSYVALTSKDAGSEFLAMCTFASYAGVIFVLLYVYCFVGEYLTQESINLNEAYYHCNWEEMPLGCKNSFMICMIYSQNHLTFTAGKFYKFTLYGFTGIVKTSMAYLSMLRTVV